MSTNQLDMKEMNSSRVCPLISLAGLRGRAEREITDESELFSWRSWAELQSCTQVDKDVKARRPETKEINRHGTKH